MTAQEIRTGLASARKSVGNFRLYDAINQMKEVAVELHAYEVSDRLRALEESYGFMSKYLAEGLMDSSREKVYGDIRDALLQEADALECLLFGKDEPGIFFNTFRSENTPGSTLRELVNSYLASAEKSELFSESPADAFPAASSRDDFLQRIFNRIWVSFPLSRPDGEYLLSILTSGESDSALRDMIVSALFLSLLQYYDVRKLSIISKALVSADDLRIRARLSVALLLVLALYPSRVALSKTIGDILAVLKENLAFRKGIRAAFVNILRARDTERINNKMKNELMPDLKKIQDSLGKKIGMDLSNISESDLAGDDVNPEWEEVLQESGMLDKMRELQDLQTEGADVLMLPFSNLKNFPFFRNVSNWFLGYNPSHSSLLGSTDDLRKIVAPLGVVGNGICDSDLYSMSFSYMAMPENHRMAMRQQLESQFSAMKEQDDLDMKQNEEDAITSFVRDLYRFFKLFPRRSEFKDPFSDIYVLAGLPFIWDVLAEQDTLRIAAEFYFKTGDYQSALKYFSELINDGNKDLQTYQKAGFAAQSVGDYTTALSYYLLASDCAEDNLWLLKKIAVSYRHLGNFEQSASYFRRALQSDADNLSLNMQYASVLLMMGKPEEALKIYYKVDYLADGGDRAQRPIAWCEFLTGNYEKSRTYYEKILFGTPTHTDYMNMGHLCLCECKLKEGIHYYRESFKESGLSPEEWRKEFEADRNLLNGKTGFTETDLNILLDNICR